eukprot:4140419-Amphidinium_carterae.5
MSMLCEAYLLLECLRKCKEGLSKCWACEVWLRLNLKHRSTRTNPRTRASQSVAIPAATQIECFRQACLCPRRPLGPLALRRPEGVEGHGVAKQCSVGTEKVRMMKEGEPVCRPSHSMLQGEYKVQRFMFRWGVVRSAA